MKRSFFGTDGIRGPYGGPVINEAFVARLGAAAAAWLSSRGKQRGTVLIGRDTRLSGPALESALVNGLESAGIQPKLLGILPTPAVSRGVRRQAADLGIVITASHNPSTDNGIKFFGEGGVKLTDAQEAEIEGRLAAVGQLELHPSEIVNSPEVVAEYMWATAALLPERVLEGWRIVIDAANGATYGTTPFALRQLGAEVELIGTEPDGTNINDGVGSEHPEKMALAVRSRPARLGIAHDGDGDRCILCDEAGVILDGDEILTILATDALTRGALAANTLVVTVQSNLGVDAAVAAAGGRVVRTPVGDRYVAEAMRKEGAMLGGESSGHIICAEISPTGDGLVAALKVIDVMRITGKPLSELRRVLKKFPQRSRALALREKKPIETLSALSAAIDSLEREFGDRGRVLVRYSGTEPKIRLLVEGPTDEEVENGIARLEAAVRASLDVV